MSRFTWLGDFLLEVGGVGGAQAPPDDLVPWDFLLNQVSFIAGVFQSEGGAAGVLQPEGGEADVFQSEGGGAGVVQPEGGGACVLQSEGGDAGVLQSDGGEAGVLQPALSPLQAAGPPAGLDTVN